VVSDEIAAHFATEEIFKEACEAAKNSLFAILYG
jgi:hypothetical protein